MSDTSTIEQLEELSHDGLNLELIVSARLGYLDEEYLKRLLACGASLEYLDHHGYSILHWLAIIGSNNYIKQLIKVGADLEVLDNAGWTPLHWAARYGYIDIIKTLLDEGANKNAKDVCGDTPWDLLEVGLYSSIPELNPNA